ncbi:glycoside hydrolase family 2 [Natrialbaceae archaeon A-CW3]
MAGKWMAGIVDSIQDGEPPSVERFRPVSVPGRPTGLAREHALEGELIAYRTSFADPRTAESDRTLLALRGAAGLTGVWLNDTEREIDPDEPYFVPTRLEFEPEPENELVLCFDPTRTPGGIYDTDEVPPAAGLPGLWWGVDLQVRPQTFISDLAVTSRLEGDGQGQGQDANGFIDVEITIDVGNEPIDDSITLSLRPEGFRGGGTMDRVAIEADAGERATVSTTLEVRDPALWWPRGYGDQHRYTVRAKLGSDSTERVVGLRTIEETEDGLVVNGRSVRARGIARLPGNDPQADVEQAVDLNATLLRVRGHAPRPDLYAACDEAGLLVWQDLPVSADELEVETGTRHVAAITDRYGFHSSLAFIGVQNEPFDPFENPLGTGSLSRLAFRWRTWRAGFDSSTAKAVADTVPDDVAAVPVTGAPGLEATATTLFPGWQYLDATDIEWLLGRYPSLGAYVGAFGAASITDDEIDADIVPGVDPSLLERHADSVDDSLAYQARTIRTVAEALRRHESTVFVAGTLRDAGPGGGQGLLTHDGTAKPAFDTLSAAYEPVQAVLDRVPNGAGEVPITLVNDSLELLETTVSWRAGERTGDTSVTVNAMGAASAGSVDVPPDADAVELSIELDDRSVQHRYDL